MDRILRETLAALPKLNEASGTAKTCKLCSGCAPLFDIVDFNKFCSNDPYGFGASGVQVPYYRCKECQFLFTDFTDDWVPGDFSRFIYNDDYTRVDPEYAGARAARDADHLRSLAAGCEGCRILDYGSGSAQFSQQMKRFGFVNMFNYDPISSPSIPPGHFDLITCFEVLEHSPDPLKTIAEIHELLASGGAVIVSEVLQPSNIEELRGSWWYLAPRNGHVSTYSDFTFGFLSEKFNLDYYRGAWFVFARKSLNEAVRQVVARIGTRVKTIQLSPSSLGGDSHWHGVEVHDGIMKFRWTAQSECIWPRQGCAAGLNRIRIPFLMEIVEGFAAQCRVFVGGAEATSTIDGHAIIAEISLPKAALRDIVLRTPTPLTPQALHNIADERRLGLAIPFG